MKEENVKLEQELNEEELEGASGGLIKETRLGEKFATSN